MNQQNDYQFVMIPQQLSSCLDANCHKMLTTLLGLHSLMAKDGWFFRSNIDLQLDSHFSQNLVKVTLDTLYQAGIIDIDCVGKGRGHRSNRIHINFESFKKYQQYSFNDIRNNPDLWIDTLPYQNHYSPSYCNKKGKIMTTSNNEEGNEIGNTLGKGIGKIMTTNTDTTDTSNTLENKLYKEEEMRVIPIEEKESYTDERFRNVVMVLEEKKPCSTEELRTIYINSFGELLSNYPSINYSLLRTNNIDSFYECYQDIVNELIMKINLESQRDCSKEDVLETLGSYLDYIQYSYQ